MSNITLILGQSGVGKSSAIRTLEPAETFIINVLGKPLPFKGANKSYRQKEAADGNLFATDKTEAIIKMIRFISAKRPDI
jgi:RNase adaptor protein for sRNA GlmZ degradation